MRWLSLSAILILFSLNAEVWADSCCGGRFRTTHKKVTELIGKWQAHSGHLASLSAGERERQHREFARAAADSPVGARVENNLALTARALSEAVKLGQKGHEKCPFLRGEAKDPANLSAAVERRDHLLRSLSHLAHRASVARSSRAPATCGSPPAAGAGGYSKVAAAAAAASCCSEPACCPARKTCQVAAASAGVCPKKAQEIAVCVRGDSCPESAAARLVSAVAGLRCEKKAASYVTRIRSAGCETSAAQVVLTAVRECSGSAPEVSEKPQECRLKDAACGSSLSGEAQTLLASWRQSTTEYASLSEAKRAENHRAMSELRKHNEVARLMPETLHTLAEGLEVLAGLNGAIHRAVETQPELHQKISDEDRAVYKAQAKLIAETHEVLQAVRATLSRLAPTSGGKA
jgi:hypothetical protein